MLPCLESDGGSKENMQNPRNTPAIFTCPLPEHFDLNTGGRGKWHISPVEITFPPIKTGKKWDSLYVCCSACELSCLGGVYKPVVASLSIGEVKRNNFVRFTSLLPVPLRVNTLSELSVEICGKGGRTFGELDVEKTELNTKCTFLLEWQPNTSLWKP